MTTCCHWTTAVVMATCLREAPRQLLPRRYLRLPLQCTPEAVLMQTGLEAPSVTAFLHENMPDFIADDGVDSAADVLGYISTSGMHTQIYMSVWLATLHGAPSHSEASALCTACKLLLNLSIAGKCRLAHGFQAQ
jgi:hypothetical protein